MIQYSPLHFAHSLQLRARSSPLLKAHSQWLTAKIKSFSNGDSHVQVANEEEQRDSLRILFFGICNFYFVFLDLKILHLMKKLLFLLMVIIATAASAYASTIIIDPNHDEKGPKSGEKGGDNADHRNNPKNNSKPTKVEEFVWMLPREVEKVDEGELEKAIVDLYKWYLQNETKINTNDFLKGGGKELVFPFKVEAKTLQQYFLFVKKNFPGLSEDDLSNVKRSLSNRKKDAPVTVRDDMENPMSISVTR